uniref:cGMP-dependent protein kinase n=1 Tax=Panagrolaimus sp. PS1159 TaxID=55785 RepID=A0AC35GIA6_9BILA
MLVRQISHQLAHLKLHDVSSIDGDAGSSDERINDSTKIQLSNLKTIDTLGIGGYGRVNLVTYNNKAFALKILNKAHLKKTNQKEHIKNEKNILLSCNSDFIVKLHQTFRDSKRLYLLMEYCPGGEVFTHLRIKGKFEEETAKYYMAAAMEAIEYLHSKCIIFRDLKPENMLLDKNGYPKLADFGFAKQLSSKYGSTFTFCGTVAYIAPEVLLNKGHSFGVDIWALGIFMAELLTGVPPFVHADPIDTYKAILGGFELKEWPKFMNKMSKSLICKFCRTKPIHRLGYGNMEYARKDEWFKGFDFESFRDRKMRPPIIPKLRNLIDTRNFEKVSSEDDFSSDEDCSDWDFNF